MENTLYTLTKLSKQFESHYTYANGVLSFELIDHNLYVTCSDSVTAIRLRLDNQSLSDHIENIMRENDTYKVDCRLFDEYYVTNRKDVKENIDWSKALFVLNDIFPNIEKLMNSEVKEPVSNMRINLELLHNVTKLVKQVKGSRDNLQIDFTLQGEFKPLVGNFVADSNEFIVVMPIKV